MKAPAPKFQRTWSPSHNCYIDNDPTKEQSTSDLLRWISDVTIKRRQIRRSTHCSNLFAEAILSSALKQARRDLVIKQEDKKKRLQLFSKKLESNSVSSLTKNDNNNSHYSLKSKLASSNRREQESGQEKVFTVTMQGFQAFQWPEKENIDSSPSSSSNSNECEDKEVTDCLSSLESFFKKLKSVKV